MDSPHSQSLRLFTGYGLKQHVSQSFFQAPKKGIITKDFAENPPPKPPPLPKPLTPVNSLCLGPPFYSKHRRKPKHEEFRGGGGFGDPKFFMLKFFVCSICTLFLKKKKLLHP